MVLHASVMNEIQSKMKEVECLSVNINFSDIQGQLTPQSVVKSGRNSKLIRDTCITVVIVTVKNGEDRVKMKALES